MLPLVEFRAPLSLSAFRAGGGRAGATDLDLAGVITASRSAAAAEDGAIFHGYAPGGISGIAPSSPTNRLASPTITPSTLNTRPRPWPCCGGPTLAGRTP